MQEAEAVANARVSSQRPMQNPRSILMFTLRANHGNGCPFGSEADRSKQGTGPLNRDSTSMPKDARSRNYQS